MSAAARRSRYTRFTALLHHIDVDALERAYRRQRRAAAAGIDGMTVESYAQGIEKRLGDLRDRIQIGRYRPLPVRRTYIPKPDGGQRPLGIPSLKDKIVQSATAELLSAIYEVDFPGDSYGFRPNRNAHQALRVVHDGIVTERVDWVLDADIRKFFDSVDHDWLVRMLEHRIADPRCLRLIRAWLEVGILEAGCFVETTEGTPQGAGISSLSANIFLLYALDLWLKPWRRRHTTGRMRLIRYADDFLLTYEAGADARRMMADLPQPLAEFRLQLHEGKTRLLAFGRRAWAHRRYRKPATFNLLGFTHYCGTTRRGRFTVQRRTQKERMNRALYRLRQEMRRRMHHRVRDQQRWLSAVLRGHYAYYGVTSNYESLTRFRFKVERAWLRSLRRRSQRSRLPWHRYRKLLAVFFLPAPRIVHVWRSSTAVAGRLTGRAGCGKAARPDLWGERRVTGAPTRPIARQIFGPFIS